MGRAKLGQCWVEGRGKLHVLSNQSGQKDHIEVLRPLLTEKYSPLRPDGNGIQSIYLTPDIDGLGGGVGRRT